MTAREPGARSVAIGLRLYRSLARAFPYEFLAVYGEELDQVTEEAIEPVWRRHGVLGLARLLADVAVRIPAEHFAELRKDVRYGFRMLGRSPGFTAVSLLSLGLGIAVAAAAFSEINAVVLRDLPDVPKPGQLVTLQVPVSYPLYQRLRENAGVFSSSFAYIAPVPFGITIGGRTERTWGHIVTPGYFSTLGIRAALGSFPDSRRDSSAVAISDRYWKAHFGSDSAIVGKTLRINGRPFTIAAVGPENFLGAAPMIFYADVWIPVSADPGVAPELGDNMLDRPDRKIFQVTGRLEPGETVERAEAQLDTLVRRFSNLYAEEDPLQKGRHITLLPGGKMVPVRPRDLPMVTALPLVLVGLVLLIACSNVANMMLVRAAARRKEIAVRLALGAGRTRLIRQLLAESMIVASGAGAFGFLLAVWLMRMVSRIRVPYPMPITYDMTPDTRVFLFTVVLTFLTGLAFGLVPALQATRPDLTPALKEGGNVQLHRYRRLSLRNLLVLVQVAGSLSLLLITGFLVIGFQRATGIDPGFDPKNLYVLSLDPVRDGYSGPQAADFLRKLLDRVRRLPSVSDATLTDTLPMSISGEASLRFADAGAEKMSGTAMKYVVGKDYFQTLGMPILRGRDFHGDSQHSGRDLSQLPASSGSRPAAVDEANGARTVVVSEALVRALWPDGDGVGRRIDVDMIVDTRPNKLNVVGAFDRRAAVPRQTVEIAGIVKDVRKGLGLEKPGPAIYFPLRAPDYSRPSLQGITLMVRTRPGAGDVISSLRAEIAAMDSRITPFNARPLAEQLDEIMGMIRTVPWTYGGIGIFGLILASVGLAGITGYTVAQRRREIGIRMALGATHADILRLVMQEGLVLITIGTAIGLLMARGATRVLAAFISAISRTITGSISDPVLLMGAPLLLAFLAMVACYVPARRSTHIDPATVLRAE